MKLIFGIDAMAGRNRVAVESLNKRYPRVSPRGGATLGYWRNAVGVLKQANQPSQLDSFQCVVV